MEIIALKEITAESLREVCILSDTLSENQKRCVASNAYSVAEAYFCNSAWFRGIALEDKFVGFVMVDKVPDDIPEEEYPAVYLWRFMIGRKWQKNGFGKQTLDLLCDKFRNEGYKYLYASCHATGDENPYEFYIKYGFQDTGVQEEGEEVLKMKL